MVARGGLENPIFTVYKTYISLNLDSVQVAMILTRLSQSNNDALILAEPGVVAGDLSAGSVDGSYDFLALWFHSYCYTNQLTSETSPESDEVGAHVPAASRVLSACVSNGVEFRDRDELVRTIFHRRV